jgi:hypothetical protein
MRSKLLLLMVVTIISGNLIPWNDGVSGAYNGQSVFDSSSDVIQYTVKERKASGYSELDIISLETFDRGTRVEGFLTLSDDVMDTFGYIYIISIGGVEVIFDNGTVSASSRSDDDLTEDVDLQVNGQQVSVDIPKFIMEDGEIFFIGSATKYVLDHTSEITFENYYDSVEGTSSNPLSKYQADIDDDRNDVRYSYPEPISGDAPHIDIISMGVEKIGNDIQITMILSDDPRSNETISYEFGIGEDRFKLSGEELISLVGTREPVGYGYDERFVSVIVAGPGPFPGEVINGIVKEELDGGSWYEDSCPDQPVSQLDIFPLDMGYDLTFTLTIDETIGEGVLEISTSDLDSSQERALLEAFDKDEDQVVSDEEVSSTMEPVRSGLLENLKIEVNKVSVIDSISFFHGGLNGEGEVTLGWRIVIDTDLKDLGELELSIPPFHQGGSMDPELELKLKMDFKIPAGYKILPSSIEPEGLINKLDVSQRSIELNSNDPTDLVLFSSGIEFKVIRDQGTSSEQEDDPVVYEDVPTWFYVICVLVVLVIMIWMYMRARKKREMPPEDF